MSALTVVTAVGRGGEAGIAAAVGSMAGLRLMRRCPDVADLLAVAQAGRADVAVVSDDFPGLDRSVLAQLRDAGTGVVGVHPPGKEESQRVLRQWGVHVQCPIGVGRADLEAAIRAVAPGVDSDRATDVGRESAADPGEPADGPTDTDPDRLDAELRDLAAGRSYVAVNPFLDEHEPDAPDDDAAPGTAIVVWGPGGAPGRTTIAVNLAAECARLGVRTVLLDADSYAACAAQHLALLDEAPGVAAAARLADSGHLDVASLAAVAPEVAPNFRVLTGLPRAERWPELREDALGAVIDQCRALAAIVIVDVAAPLEADEELSYDVVAPRRNGATLTALDKADTVLAVGAADPVGLQRLVRGLEELRSIGCADPLVLANKVRAAAVGHGPAARVSEALQRFAGIEEVLVVPDDRDALDAALLAGRVLAEDAPGSPARRALSEIAARLTGVPQHARRRRLTRR